MSFYVLTALTYVNIISLTRFEFKVHIQFGTQVRKCLQFE